jgi:hypothetical protein
MLSVPFVAVRKLAISAGCLYVTSVACTSTPVARRSATVPSTNVVESPSAPSEEFGPVRQIKPRPGAVRTYIECPTDESFYVTEIEPNTFEMGIGWDIPTRQRKTSDRSRFSLYTRYRCIPR